MQSLKFKTVSEKEYMPITPMSFKDGNGNDLSGDDLLRKFGKIIASHEKKGKPVPIPDQRFIQWVKQACEMLSAGKSSVDIFAETIVRR